MRFSRKLLKMLFGIDFIKGDKVYWNNPVDVSFTGEYTVTAPPNEQGLVGVYNDKKKDRFVHAHELTLIGTKDKNRN